MEVKKIKSNKTPHNGRVQCFPNCDTWFFVVVIVAFVFFKTGSHIWQDEEMNDLVMEEVLSV